jgi:hypothetical protein
VELAYALGVVFGHETDDLLLELARRAELRGHLALALRIMQRRWVLTRLRRDRRTLRKT